MSEFPPDIDWAVEMRRTARCLREESLPGMEQVIAGNEAIADHIEFLRAEIERLRGHIGEIRRRFDNVEWEGPSMLYLSGAIQDAQEGRDDE